MKKSLAALSLTVAVCSTLSSFAIAEEKECGVIAGTVEKTVETPFTVSGWVLGKSSNLVKASIKSPLRAAGYIVTVPGVLANKTLDAVGDAAEAPGNIAQTVLNSLGDGVSEAAAAPIDACRDIVEAPKASGKKPESRVID